MKRSFLTSNMDGSVSGLNHQLQDSASLPHEALPQLPCPQGTSSIQRKQQTQQVTGPPRCPPCGLLGLICRAGSMAFKPLSPDPFSCFTSCTSIQPSQSPCRPLSLDFLPPHLAHVGSPQKAHPAPPLFTLSASLLSKPYLSTHSGKAPLLCAFFPFATAQKPCLPSTTPIFPAGGKG